ncbi:hypothetical protein PMIN02_002896 [Paraphaeosphaeria minitans]
MQPSLMLCAVSLLQFRAFTFAHNAGHDILVPGIFGGRSAIRHLPRHMIKEMQGYSASNLQKRDTNKKCGLGVGFCDPGDCCSPIDYSNGCDATSKPLGESTLNVSRPLIGNVSYDGAGIDHCKNPGAIALTFDDGPYNYTSHLLDVLGEYGAKATFFITGNNLGKGQIDIEETGWPDIIRRMHAEGHQIAGHSWGHQNMSSLNETEQVHQVEYLEMAIRNILGFFPTYFRPPYDDCHNGCQTVLKRMGYHITFQNVVNNDWQNDDGSKIEISKEKFLASMRQTNSRDANYIFLMHDTHYQSSWNLTSYMLDYFELFNFSRSVTVGECMGDPPENWYRADGGAANHSLLLHTSRGSNLRYSTLLLICAQFIVNMFV